MVEFTEGEAKALVVILADASQILATETQHIPLALNLRYGAEMIAKRIIEAQNGDAS